MNGAELIDLNVQRNGDSLDMVVTVRTGSSLTYQQVVALQKAIVDGINEPVSLKVSQVIAENLDPLIPPTPTRTPTSTNTPSPGPSPTASNTPTPSATATSTITGTATNTATQLPTATPSDGEVVRFSLPSLRMYQNPGGPSIGYLNPGQKIYVLTGREMFEGLIWVEIRDSDDRLGWIPEVFIQILYPTLTPTNSSRH